MKKTLLTIVAFFFVGVLNAQITIDRNDMPNVNDTLRTSSSISFNVVDVTQTGPNFVWDYSALVPASQSIDSFVAISTAGSLYQLYFLFGGGGPASIAERANANALLGALPVSNPFTFYNESNTDFQLVAYGATYGGTQIPIGLGNNDYVYRFPMNFGNSDSSDSDVGLPVPNIGYYGNTQHRVNHVDGWGALTTPYGTFNTLRVHSVLTGTDTVYSDSLGTGGSQVRNTTHEYKWLGKNQSIPLLQVNTTEAIPGIEAITSIIYRDSVRNSLLAVGELEGKNLGLFLQPNPAIDASSLRFFLDKPGDVQITVFDVNGKVALSRREFGVPGLNEVALSTGTLSAGLYQIRVMSDNQTVGTKSWLITRN